MTMRRGVFIPYRVDPRYIIRGNPQTDMLLTPAVHGINQPQLVHVRRSNPPYPQGRNLFSAQDASMLLPNANISAQRSSGGTGSGFRGRL